MNIEKIQEEWEKDSIIDPDNLHDESLKIPQLHSKYFDIYNSILILKESTKEKEYFIKLEKYNYYSGKSDPEVYVENPFPYKIRDKESIQRYMDADKDISKIRVKLKYYEIMINYLESIIKTISNRSFHISNAIQWNQFQAGFN
jgi:hypothetical protein